MTRAPAPETGVVLREVAFDDPAARALRDAMDVEMGAVYADRAAGMSEAIRDALHVEPATVVLTLLAELDGEAVGHAALRRLPDGSPEVKRVFTTAAARGRGVADLLVAACEDAARRGGAARVVLQTGDRQEPAERLYRRRGWTPIPIYPPYEAITFSRCYELRL
ncbi:GNAT family N-acetyltransferase [Rhodococcus aerolatus]